MSELMNARNGGRDFHRQLLTTVSALALLAAVYGSGEVQAEDQDSDRPTIWIELGGQLERMNGSQETFSPPFMASIKQANLVSTLDDQKPPAYALGGEGKISFQPDGSDWVFSASALYGRANATLHRHQQTANAKVPLNITLPPPYRTAFGFTQFKYGSYYPHNRVRFADATAKQSETHAVLDFQAGKDVGLGMFGNHGSSVLSAGVRFAQFNSKSSVNLHAEPDLQYPTAPIIGTIFAAGPLLSAFQHAAIHFHDYAGTEISQRSFHGLGPSLSWSASAPFVGNSEHGEITLDWGANAAVLFGRQKVQGHHQTAVKSYYYNNWKSAGRANGNCGKADPCEKAGFFYNKTQHPTGEFATYNARPTAQRTNAAPINRMRSVTVPNLGGFAGLSFLYANAKVSFGYRADFFFGAVDGGIDAAKKENIGFYGPFATVSVGIP